MALSTSPQFFKLLANDIRWQIVQILSSGDMSVQEILAAVRQPQNLVSYHLHKLHAAGLVVEHRSSADGREIYYGLHLQEMRSIFKTVQDLIHPGLAVENENGKLIPYFRVLVLCTHNSARSQMAEGFLRAICRGRLEISSAGAEPLPVHPAAIQAMLERGIDIRSQQSKNQELFLGQNFDYIITVCDRAREICPVFPGAPRMIHWSIADPSTPSVTDQEQQERFRLTALELESRVGFFIAWLAQNPAA